MKEIYTVHFKTESTKMVDVEEFFAFKTKARCFKLTDEVGTK